MNKNFPYEFTLLFSIKECAQDVDDIIEALGEAGCNDMLIGIGQVGRMAMMFDRDGTSAADAVGSAIRDVKAVIPDIRLLEASPDLVGLTDTAELLGFSRQNMRKLMTSNPESFPAPVHEGKQALWPLETLLTWLREHKQYEIDDSLLELAKANRHLNLASATRSSDPDQLKAFGRLLAGD
ncbi:DNA-binding protein [Endozoicomonas sp. 8E]|uniref:helix-turn-helix transcriptional regulator n=1 Tax=Endozoicomonas sp. 8E TaxID=3035692 RepID=UPI002938D699|nr:DNA-binding protein [Endozoicomonas sp. 8E]WOG27859.1 DNA-binding protein [Endozoicomonas sp. 8E]